MASSVQHFQTNTLFVIPNKMIFKKAHVSPLIQIPKFSLKSIKMPLKQICREGNLREAFQSLSSNQNTFQFCLEEPYSLILELCASKKALSQGKQIHAHMMKSYDNFDSAFLSTKLVHLYGKCGSLLLAEKVFDRMRHRTIFTWNAMIGACVSNGEHLGALELYREMRVSGVHVDAYTFPCVLKACGARNDHHVGAEIHGLATKCGYVMVVFVANALVSMYAKCDDLRGARLLFDSIIEKEDPVSWNSIMSAYSANGQSLEALELLRKMQEVSLARNTYTFVAALQACENSSCRKLGMEIHAVILKYNHHLDVYVANALIAMYARCGKMEKAASILKNMDYKDCISWNTVLSGFVQNDLCNDALKYFQDMWNSGRKPDQVSMLNIIAASGRLGNLFNGMEAHAYAIKNGLASDLLIGNALTDMYSKCCYVEYMGRTFEKMPDKDFISWTTIIAGYAQNECHVTALKLFQEAQTEGVQVDTMMIGSILMACSGLKCKTFIKEIHGYVIRRGLSYIVLQNSIIDVYGECGNIDYARHMFHSIESKDIVSWTSMMSSYVHNGLANEALELFQFLKETNIEPDSIAMASLLSAAASLSALNKGKEIHGFLIRMGFLLEGSTASSLVDLYARCGTLENSSRIFTCTKKKDLVLWTRMINAYGMHGRGKVAIDLFYKMRVENVVPDRITFLALLYACSHSGLITEGKNFMEIMKYEYRLEPWPEHYACLVDLLGRANCLEEAYHYVKSMQTEPTAEVWCALLGACRIHSNKELGEIAAEKLLQLDPNNPGNFVLVSNVYAENERWNDVEEVRMRMKGVGLKKNPGCSWIVVGNKVHAFMARDKSHPQSDIIYHKLAQVTETLENEGGYVAQTNFVLHNVGEKEKVHMLYGHSERLAIAYGLLDTLEGTTIRITKNLRVCGDCHTFCKLVSKFFGRRLIVRDASRFHHFENGDCSCGDFW
ncbi:Pentatricopeptide repeat-containing protein [Quillaja saponaria]|uniref:Pentatricopeptide repeat-containing protein n=1 Tax=Quillaja saponaria TaxID=32244 RepID=A0AAD7VJ09_QUISA|nr:Pentatricopeptide repeat-containing protein [Quillaja saponaria]